MLCDALGNPIKFTITPGQVHDVTEGVRLLEGEEAEYVLADKCYTQPALFEKIRSIGAEIVIPNRLNQIEKRGYDEVIYKEKTL